MSENFSLYTSALPKKILKGIQQFTLSKVLVEYERSRRIKIWEFIRFKRLQVEYVWYQVVDGVLVFFSTK